MTKTILSPAIVLIEPQLAENIGATARAMMNFCLCDLRLVNPRDGWPNPKAIPMAVTANKILEQAQVFSCTEDAIKDCTVIHATTARLRNEGKQVLAPREATQMLYRHATEGGKPCILFGCERAGLNSQDISKAHDIIIVPTNPNFSSLNLAQCVLLLGYEWFQAQSIAPDWPRRRKYRSDQYASNHDISNFQGYLIESLEKREFFRKECRRKRKFSAVESLIRKQIFTIGELHFLRSIIKTLEYKARGKAENHECSHDSF
jgi:tRNA/rRNA methyltransferase